MREVKITALLGLLLATNSFAQTCEVLLESIENKNLIKVDLRTLRPTQFAVGYKTVEEKIEKLHGMNDEKLQSYIKKRPIPLVIGPGATQYSVDKHHLGLALLKSHYNMSYGYIKDDLSDSKSMAEFWERMVEKGYAYPKDENGIQRNPESLPKSYFDLRDDPYRSLASAVREKGGYEKTKTAFSEFAWADFFRDRIKIESGESGFEKAVSYGLELAHSKAAKKLPGYIGDKAALNGENDQ